MLLDHIIKKTSSHICTPHSLLPFVCRISVCQFHGERSSTKLLTGNNNVDNDKDSDLDFLVKFKTERHNDETPIQRAVRLVRLELDQVESKNQVEHYLRAFNVSNAPQLDNIISFSLDFFLFRCPCPQALWERSDGPTNKISPSYKITIPKSRSSSQTSNDVYENNLNNNNKNNISKQEVDGSAILGELPY